MRSDLLQPLIRQKKKLQIRLRTFFLDGVTSAIEKAENKSDFSEVVCNIAPTMYCNYIIFYSVEATAI